MPQDVFISHSAKDKAVADAVCALLERRGHRCWIAPRDVSGDWAKAIVDAIRRARAFVLIFSREANLSPQVNREVERAVSNGVPVIPLRIENVTPSDSLEYFISNLHWLDALTPPIENHLDPLADAVDRLLAAPATASPPAPLRPAASGSAKPSRNWPFWIAAVLVLAALAGGTGYWLSLNPGTETVEANVQDAKLIGPTPKLVAPMPEPVPQPLAPLLDFASVPVSSDSSSITPAESYLRQGIVPAWVSAISPAGAQLLFADRTSLSEGMAFRMAGRTLLVLETSERSSASFSLRFASPIAEFRAVRPRFSFYPCPEGTVCAATADHIYFPAFTVTAFDDRGRPVARLRRERTQDEYRGPADTIALSAPDGIRELRFEAEDSILFLAAGATQPRQSAFRAFAFELLQVRPMPR